MKLARAFCFCVLACAAHAMEIDDFFDRLDSALTATVFQDKLRARLSGTLDLEYYHLEQPPPGLIASKIDNLFDPRLKLFLDVQFGSHIYFFAQSRLDRGFDPTDQGAQIRLDEYALRVTPWDDNRFTLQIGKFATVIGTWAPRQSSWDNPFINAPLVYENVTAISDKRAPASPVDFITKFDGAKYEFTPVIWGPNYTSGVSLSGRLGEFDYAAEMKNSSLSSRPESWNATAVGFDQPTFSGRLGFRPTEMWNFGLSASDGAYFRPEAESTLPRDRDIGDYRELLLGQDASFAWHHLQVWAEFYEVRFEVPRVGNADTFGYYLEAEYKFAPKYFGALRWNQQLFDSVRAGTLGHVRWGQDLGRVDCAVGYRFAAHTQLKLQYSFQQETSGARDDNHFFATQFTVRF